MKPYQHGYGAEARSVQAPKMSHTEQWKDHHREGRFLMNTAARQDPSDQILFTTRKVN